MNKLVGRTIVFIMVFFLLILFVKRYADQPNILKEAREGVFNPDVMIELEGIMTGKIDDSRFKFKVFGFDDVVTITSERPLTKPLPSSDLHSAIVWGHFDLEGVFHLKDYRISYFQFMKYVTSFIGFIWFLFLFFKEWRLTLGGFEEREKCQIG